MKTLRYRFLLFLIASFFGSHAQEIHTPSRISLHIDNQAIASVLDSIANQTDIHFSYNPQLIHEGWRISISAEDEELETVLGNIFPDTIGHERIGYHIILFRQERPENNELIISKDSTKNSTNEKIISVQDTGTLKQENIPQDSLPTVSAEQTITPQRKIAQLSWVTPLGTAWIATPQTIFNLSFNVVGGVTGGVRGLEMASAFNINLYEARGAQFAAGFNLTGVDRRYHGLSRNVQFAAGFNFTRKGFSMQFAAGANIADTATVQAAAGVNLAWHSYAQLAAGMNITQYGKFQASGGVNVAKKSNVQLAAGVNVVDTIHFQFAGGVNVARKSSCQLGIVNVTKRGGFQMGIVNVCDTADGVPFGLLNIVCHGGVMEFGIEGGEFMHTSLTFRSGVRKLYTILSLGMNFESPFISSGIGLGSSILWKNRIGLNFELMHHTVFAVFDSSLPYSFNDEAYNGLVQFRPFLNLRIVDHFKIFLGPSFNLFIQKWNDDNAHDEFFNISQSLYSKQIDNVKLDFWVGITGGFKF
ncbi:MAG: hypothetical protein LBV02_08065 [Bacteroidales bacterium]|jgi:hypothetical protein|nr:hypothetical protein [Bacteroidales bacterium]